MARITPGIRYALLAAVIFGATTPFAKRLSVDVNPQLFAGLLYLGSGSVLGASLLVKPGSDKPGSGKPGSTKQSSLQRRDLPALSMAVVFGGIVAPLLLLIGLQTTPAASASLLLNLEAVFTAVGAWVIAREHADRGIVAGMICIVAGGVLLSISPSGSFAITAGSLGIVGACVSWGIDNVATRPLAIRDPRQIAAVKGLVAGTVNVVIGFITGASLPSFKIVISALIVGFVGYGLSLVFAVMAMRELGTARTGAYYGAAPFVGVAVSLVWLRESVGPYFIPALALMGVGLALHLREDHQHRHRHVLLPHEHGHDHEGDEHHRHAHNDGSNGLTHTHAEIEHEHGHTPDEHHRHRHGIND